MKIQEANRRHSVSRIMDHSGTQRRLIMAALRLAHRVLGIRRKRLGFGVPGLGTARLVGASVAIAVVGLASVASAQEVDPPPGNETLLFATLLDTSQQSGAAGTDPSTAIAIGTGAAATAAEAVAIGTNVTASNGKAVSIGSGNVASGDGAVAIGDPNTATGTGAIALGADNTATGNGTVAIGNQNMVGGGGQAIGVAGTAAQGAVGMGYQNTVTGQGAVAMGDRSVANGGSAVALGRQANATGLSAVAIGQTSAASNTYAVAIGGLASASGAESVAMGTGAQGATSMSVAVGSNAAAQANAGDVALGAGSATGAVVNTTGDVIDGVSYTYAGTSASSTVSVGQTGAERTITNVAAGRVSGSSTDAVNGSQLFATNTAVTDLGSTVTNLGNSTASNLGGGSVYDPATGTVGAPSYTVQGGTYNNVGDALGAADTALTNNTTDIAALQTDALQWNSTLGAYDASHGSG
ncbi:hypothetical protein NHF53_22130, partial [Ciceribacter sp. RN22]|nr:hypothetical protein [Ciceribacter sp. RN22]